MPKNFKEWLVFLGLAFVGITIVLTSTGQIFLQ
jgi:hypothetical protein